MQNFLWEILDKYLDISKITTKMIWIEHAAYLKTIYIFLQFLSLYLCNCHFLPWHKIDHRNEKCYSLYAYKKFSSRASLHKCFKNDMYSKISFLFSWKEILCFLHSNQIWIFFPPTRLLKRDFNSPKRILINILFALNLFKRLLKH